MFKNIKLMILLFVAAAAMLNLSCNREEPEPEPEIPQIMDIVGTTWRFYYEGDVQGMEIVMSDALQVLSADSIYRYAYAEMAGQLVDQSNTCLYTWDGTTLNLPDINLVLTYRDSDNVFIRIPDPNDQETAQMMTMLGITEFVYHKQ